MPADFILPCEGDWTVDDLAVLPEKFRYELVDGRLLLDQRGSLTELAGIALLGALKECCPDGYRLAPHMPLWPERDDLPPPDVVVLGPEGDVVLVVDVIRCLFADMLTRVSAVAKLGVPAYWVFEARDDGSGLSEFRRSAAGEFDAVTTAWDRFATEVPFPVAVDVWSMTHRWPLVFSYLGGPSRMADSQ